ncbi:hypothetical protein DPX16_0808 [Anabarilius grahami]|uniref:Immunoglobulin V-set domain-containing protein n=1 Tax=Anabarilius grahami TaxID=495550 RepID=A0A3N0Z9R5_ANAGA|nr:hypothetical protein DPX16_0808 [Anabarilius grahami]
MVTWYFYDTQIARVTGELSKICTDVQWKDNNERYRERLKLSYQFTWSLTITNVSTTDSGLYTLKIIKSNFTIMRSFTVTVTGHSPLLSAALQPSLHSSSPITTEPAVYAQASKQVGPSMTVNKQLWHIHWYGRNINNMIYIDYGLPIL